MPTGSPSGSDTMCINSGMFGNILPPIPNLEAGYTFSFGQRVQQGRLWGDYVVPINLGACSVVFGQAHGAFEKFSKEPALAIPQQPGFTTTVSGHQDRLDLSFGGGYRTLVNCNTMLGGNAFYDSSRLFEKWYSSGGFGLELATNVFTNAAFDVNFNWYGNLFSRGTFINAWRNGRGSFDLEAGYSEGLFENALDLRVKGVGYSFDVGDRIWGWKLGADLTTRDGMFAVKYEYGRDRLDGSYQNVTAQVNIGFQLENILAGESPVTMPSPVFVNPRNLGRLLGLKVKRNWHQPTEVLAFNRIANPTPSSCDRTIAPFTLVNLGGGVYSANIGFLAFPYASLTPAGVIHVTVTLANPAPAGLVVSVAVIGDNNVTTNQGFTVTAGGENSLTIALTTVQPQSLFITNSTSPNHLTITAVGAFATDGIASACILFNQ